MKLSEIKAREQKATKGKWEWVCKDADSSYEIFSEGVGIVTMKYGLEEFQDADFIAHSRSDIPWLLRMVEEARKLIRELEGTPIEHNLAMRLAAWLSKVEEEEK